GIAVGSNGAAFLTLNGTDWGTVSGTVPVAATYMADTYSPGTNTDVTTFVGNPASFTTNTLRFNAGGGGTLTLTGTNVLAAGGILIGSGSGAVTIDGTGTLAGSAVAGTVAAPINGELGIFQHSASALTISAAIVNSGMSFIAATAAGTTLNKHGTGTLILSSTGNAWTGGTNIANGILRLGAANVLPNGIGTATSGNVTIATAGTLDLNGFSEIINGLAGSGVVDSLAAGSMTLTIGDSNAAQTFTGVIRNTAGTLSLAKIGTGIQTLSGANTYSGSTTIARGTLLLNFTTAGAPLSNILPSTLLTLGSGTLNVTGSTVANSQTFSGVTLAGGGIITAAGTTPNITLNLGTIT
ncbi:MAG: autotransporter-associated beta strand repeat-containing protein, partial [Gammaproteobacteria bacterium]|nr:autotransporter-associated beta strand repeat-containing protein [Gammaproteobacteria bacterium]